MQSNIFEVININLVEFINAKSMSIAMHMDQIFPYSCRSWINTLKNNNNNINNKRCIKTCHSHNMQHRHFKSIYFLYTIYDNRERVYFYKSNTFKMCKK